MNLDPVIRFQIGSEIRLSKKDSRWQVPFPVSLPQTPAAPTISDPISYGTVFERLGGFVNALLNAPAETGGSCLWPGKPAVERIADITISLEKHGQFYHPFRLTWSDAGRSHEMAMTLAVGDLACDHLKNETDLLKYLKSCDIFDGLPQVYGFQPLAQDANCRVSQAVMMGEWCHGYHEFHFSQPPDAEQTDIVIWSHHSDPLWLPHRKWYDLYYKVAAILTSFYNPISGEQVFPWHHAAGDFIIKPIPEGLAVKLITVRQYAALQDGQSIPEPKALNGLLFFLLNLSIRTRIDRLDGVGDYHWAPEPVLEATLAGFFCGLKARAERDPLLDRSLVAEIHEYLRCFTGQELRNLLEAVCGSYHPEAPDLVMISRHLSAHATELEAVLAGMARL